MKTTKKLMLTVLCITGGILWAQEDVRPEWILRPGIKDGENPQEIHLVGVSAFHTSERGARDAAEEHALTRWARLYGPKEIITMVPDASGLDTDEENAKAFRIALRIIVKTSGMKAEEYYIETTRDSRDRTRYKAYVLMGADRKVESVEFINWTETTQTLPASPGVPAENLPKASPPETDTAGPAEEQPPPME